MSDDVGSTIDRDKVRQFLRKLDEMSLLDWLFRAIDLLPEAALVEVMQDYVDPGTVMTNDASVPALIDKIRAFHRDALAGRYYEGFAVDSRNFMLKSRGTEMLILEHARLMAACLRAEERGELETAAEGIGLLIDLLREVDEARDDIVFFADEGGSWQFGVDWQRVLPAWFRSLSPALDPPAWAETVAAAIRDFGHYPLETFLAAAHEAATPEQGAALAPYESDLRKRRR